MKYRSIRKMSFELNDQEALEKLYQERLRSPSTYRLDLDVGGFPPFIMIDGELLNLVVSIYKSNQKLDALRRSLPQIAIEQYTRSILIEEIGLTNEIENIHSTRREIENSLEEVERSEKRRLDLRFMGMIEKYNRLIDGGEVPLATCEDVRALYDQLVLPEVKREKPENAPDGRLFRSSPVSIRNTHDIKIHEGLFPEETIISAMKGALVFLQDETCNWLIRVAVFHHLFGYIHPFYDGNGRMSRFISSYLLSKEINPLIALRLSAVIKNEKVKYYRLFKETNERRNRGDLTNFVYGFLEFILETLEEVREFLEANQSTLKKYGEVLRAHPRVPKKHESLWIMVQNALFAESGLCVNDLVRITRQSRTTIDKEIEIYRKNWQLLSSRKEGRNTIYRLEIDRLLDFLQSTISKDE